MSPSLVTIVTSSYNQAAYLEETIRSVLEQDYPSLEYIVVDGGSTDGSVEIIRRYADRLAYWVSEPDRGQSDALNKGFARSHGDVIAWLNSDDLYLPGAVRGAVEAFRARTGLGLVYGDCDVIDERGEFVEAYPSRPFSLANTLRGHPPIAQPAAFFSREAWRRVGPLRTDLHYCMDLDLWMRIAERFDVAYVPERWAQFRLYGQSKSGSGREPFEREEAAVRRAHQRRAHLLRLALARPGAFTTPEMLVYLAARMLPRPLMRRVNRARGFPAEQD
jgi:glycosyltransferase involved in cell wall biosynthesis